MTTIKRTVYKLKLDDSFLKFEDHGDGTRIFVLADEWSEPVYYKTQEGAIAAICDDFNFHHGCGSISDKDSAKDRLAKIKLVKSVVIEEEEIIEPGIYVPTNIEVHQWYVAAKGDDGLRFYLKSQVPGWEQRSTHFYDDGYEFASDYYRIRDYNDWVAAGKPVKPSVSERIAKARGESKND